jgi:putative nucleotidyltransferase with HDIG domain
MSLLHRRLGGTFCLPSLPVIVTRIQQACRDPQVGMRDVAQLIGQDPPLCARSMRVVNSAYYGLEVPVTSIEHAVAVLGMDAIQTLVIQVAAIHLFQHLREREDFDARSLWAHSILTGRIARELPARLRPGVEGEELELAGLLHDIGKFVLLDLERDRYVELVVRAQSERRPLRELEREALGFDHSQVGAVLANRWNLPELVGRCIALHHETADPAALALPGILPLVLADRLARAVQEDPGNLPQNPLAFLEPEVVSRLALQPRDMQSLATLARHTLERIAL